MAVGPGKSAVLKVGTAAAETDITAYCDKITPHFLNDKNDTSAFGAFKSSVPGQYELSMDFEGPWSPAVHAILQPLRAVLGKSIVFGPQGSTVGYYRQQFTGWLTYEISDASIGAAVKFKCTFHGNSAVDETTTF